MHTRHLHIIVLFAAVLLLADIATAQYHYFGRNKVQYTDFDWHVLETDHFNIYFYPDMKDVAEIGAAAAESAYVEISAHIDHSLQKPVPLIFYSSHLLFQQTNVTPGFIPEGVGGFFEFIKGRVVIPSNGNMYQFKRVIWHEMVHVLMTSKINRITQERGKLTHPGPPLWFIEGLAEYWSADRLDAQSKMILRDAVLNNYFVPLTQIYRIRGSYLMYKEGESLLHFIADTYGKDKILMLIENIWRFEDFTEVMEFVLGDPVEEISDKWHFHLKRQIYPLLEDEELPQATTRMITRKGVNHSPTIYEKDGEKMVAFVSNRTGYTNIYTKPLDAAKRAEPTLLVEGERNKRYEAFHFLESSLDIGNNNTLIFVTKSGESDALHLFDVEAEQHLQSYTFPDIVGISSPTWNADGTKIVFSGMAFSGMVDLYVFDIQNEQLVRLTHDVYNDRSPVLSPDDKYLYFTSDRTDYGIDGYTDVFRFDMETGDMVYVTHEQSVESTPVISPDGNSLAFISDRGGTNNVWVADISDESYFGDLNYRVRPVTDFATAALHPNWATDSTLVCMAFDSYQFQLHEITVKPVPEVHIPWASMENNQWDHPEIPISDSTNVESYQEKYSLDLAVGQVSNDPIFGTSGGGAIAFSDVMGNHRYEVLVYNTAESSGEFWERFNVMVSKYNLERRANFGYGLYHFNNLYYTPREGFFNERRYGGNFLLRYPFSQFRRLEASMNVALSEKTVFGPEGPLDSFLISNFAGYVMDNSIWGPTGPMDGRRFLFRAGFTNDIRFNNVNYYTLIADYRRYIRLHQRVSYALRVMALRSEGNEARRFYIGGSWTLRGYPRFRIWGKN
ncbi:MAG: hypothetical protein GF372_05275, partial [Candidatus Marinimicrobia bacterium]|nr:hypothetical protein [Candidatus Neomarinimicrobiota bacterium]